MSAKDKIVLDGDCQTNIYTKDTIPENKNEYIIEILSIVLKHIKGIDNEQDYYLKDIDQLYVQMDKYENKRYIVVAFIYDIRNFYTMKIAVDFVRKHGDDELYVNSIGNEFSSNYDVLNRYDFSIFSHGYLMNYNMFEKDARAILDENYKKYFRLIGIDDSTLEYHLLTNTYKINKANITKTLTAAFPPSVGNNGSDSDNGPDQKKSRPNPNRNNSYGGKRKRTSKKHHKKGKKAKSIKKIKKTMKRKNGKKATRRRR